MVDAFNAELAERIGSARKLAGKTQQQIADALSIHVNQYQRLETGKHRVSAYDLTRVASAIGVPAGDLLPPPPQPRAAAQSLSAAQEENERLRDKVDGLEADLQNAVETAFNRGATEWTRLNYPKLYAALSTTEGSDNG